MDVAGPAVVATADFSPWNLGLRPLLAELAGLRPSQGLAREASRHHDRRHAANAAAAGQDGAAGQGTGYPRATHRVPTRYRSTFTNASAARGARAARATVVPHRGGEHREKLEECERRATCACGKGVSPFSPPREVYLVPLDEVDTPFLADRKKICPCATLRECCTA